MKPARGALGTSCLAFIFCLLSASVAEKGFAATFAAPPKVAVLDFGDAETGRRGAEKLGRMLGRDASLFAVVDQAQSRAAAIGVGYRGSLNMTLREARDLGAAVGCDFFVTGSAQTLRRSSSANPVYYESSAVIFFVGARTGRLLFWENLNTEAATHEAAEAALLNKLDGAFAAKFSVAMRRAREDDELRRRRRGEMLESTYYEEVPEEDGPEAKEFRAPQPYRRLRPRYTDEAARFEVEAVVDVAVEINADGEVANVEVVRWAGYGLDESVIETVRQLHFRPAMRAGRPVPVRVLLRYNFRRPTKDAAATNR